MVDAKRLFDLVSKVSGGSRNDRRSSVDVSIVRQSLEKTGSVIRWVPHQLMPADAMTKSDVSKASFALSHFLRTGGLSLVLEGDEVRKRLSQKGGLGRSKRASQRRLEEASGTC